MMKAFVEPRPSPGAMVDSQVGALIEIRFFGSATVDDIVAFETKLVTLVRRVVQEEKRRAVLCTDLRSCQVLRPEVSDRIVKLMENDNPHIQRNAFLVGSSALPTLQVQRFISESGGQSRRRVFADEPELVGWLSEVTTIAEQARLPVFLVPDHAGAC